MRETAPSGVPVFWDDRNVCVGTEVGTGIKDEGREGFVSTEPPGVGRFSCEGGEEEEEEGEEKGSKDGWVGGGELAVQLCH